MGGRLLLLWLLCFCLLGTWSASEPPRAVAFESARFRLEAQGGQAASLQVYARMCEEALDRLAPDYQLDSPEKIRVLLAPTRNAFQESTGQHGHRTMAAAFPEQSHIVLNGPALLAADPTERFRTIGHELVHVLLGRLSQGRVRVPFWLHEGLAQLVVGEDGVTDPLRLAWAHLWGSRIPMERLIDRFPYGDPQASLAYAQSASFTRFVATRYYYYDNPNHFLHNLLAQPDKARGLFVQMCRKSNVRFLETLWVRSSGGAENVLHIASSTSLLWIGIVLLFLLAYVRKRRRERQVMEQWDAWEREEDS